jgi:hypothetical protein
MLNNEGEKIRKESSMPYSWHLPGGSEESHENPVTTDDLPVEIQTQNFSNMSLRRYHYSNRLGACVWSVHFG